jgi:hypothetical protein
VEPVGFNTDPIAQNTSPWSWSEKEKLQRREEKTFVGLALIALWDDRGEVWPKTLLT